MPVTILDLPLNKLYFVYEKRLCNLVFYTVYGYIYVITDQWLTSIKFERFLASSFTL